MSEETVRTVLTDALDSPIEVGEKLWPHILYETLGLSEAASVLRAIEREPLPRF